MVSHYFAITSVPFASHSGTFGSRMWCFFHSNPRHTQRRRDLSRPVALPFLNHGFVPARLFIIAHTYEQDFSGKACEGSGVAFFLDLPDGRIGGLVPLELDDERRFLRVLRTRQEREVGKALARRQLAHDVVEPPCAVKSEGQRIGERVLVVVLDMARLEMRPLYAPATAAASFSKTAASRASEACTARLTICHSSPCFVAAMYSRRISLFGIKTSSSRRS